MQSIFWLIPDSVCGRPGPVMQPWSIAELRGGGIDTIINLSEQSYDSTPYRAVGIETYSVPLPTDIPPTIESVARCVEALPRALAILLAQVEQKRRVLIHCYAGKDRTGMLLAALLAKKHGLSARAAINKVREVRPLAITSPGWEAMALEVIPLVAASSSAPQTEAAT